MSKKTKSYCVKDRATGRVGHVQAESKKVALEAARMDFGWSKPVVIGSPEKL